MSCVVALALVAIPMPAFAEASPGENVATAFSGDGGETFDYFPVADTDGFDANITHIRLWPSGALLPAVDKYERFSLRHRMKVK